MSDAGPSSPAPQDAPAAPDAEMKRRSLPGRILRRGGWWIGVGLFWLSLLILTLWGTLAIYYANTRPEAGPRRIMAGLFFIAVVAVAIFVRPRRRSLAGVAVLFVGVFTWYLLLKPSNTRDWELDVAREPTVTFDGDKMTVHNVRNFEYRSEKDYTPHWEDRVYDVNSVRTADVMLVYWGSKAIAHVMVSFGFEDGRHLCASIETRKEKGEEYSAVQGFFRQFELIFILADERDLVRLRTNYRNEQVYVYRATAKPEAIKRLLLTYARHANKLHEEPEFYNALTTNCATSVLYMAEENATTPTQGLSWEILLSGYAAQRFYRNGQIDTSLPFEELERRSLINDAARSAGKADDFSAVIRKGLPGYGQLPPQPK